MERSEMLVLFVVLLSCGQGDAFGNITGTTDGPPTNGTSQPIATTAEVSRSSPATGSGTSSSSSSRSVSSVGPPPASSSPPSSTASPQTDVLSSAGTGTPVAPTNSSSGSNATTPTAPNPTTGGSACVSGSCGLTLLLLSASCVLMQRAHT